MNDTAIRTLCSFLLNVSLIPTENPIAIAIQGCTITCFETMRTATDLHKDKVWCYGLPHVHAWMEMVDPIIMAKVVNDPTIVMPPLKLELYIAKMSSSQ